ncbi:hypothetical protein [Falsiroseomonas sp. E2-1-a20]|uniref:hypothetical protein n=1 Tax=Falsiroseomonas sp. E2-1-a20 TaxID=3239300 RepID=UPI003F3E6188
MKVQKRLLIGLCVAGILAMAARPAWDILVSIFEDSLSDHGAAVFSFFGERPDEVRIVAFRLGENVRLSEEASGRSYTIPSASDRGTMSGATMSAREGRQQAEIRYRVGQSAEAKVFQFDVEFIAQSQCDVAARFGEEGPRASACTNHRPASYGGTWRH